MWLLAGEVLVWFGFVGLVWVRRHLVQIAPANMEIAYSKVLHSTWKPLGEKKNFFDWSIYSRDPMTRKSSLGFIKLRPPTSPEWQSLMGPICPCYQGQFEYCLVQILAIKLWPQKNTIFYNVVTVFFSLQRKLTGKKKKNYCFKNSGPEEITPPIPLDQSSLDHLSRPCLILETKRNKKGNKAF